MRCRCWIVQCGSSSIAGSAARCARARSTSCRRCSMRRGRTTRWRASTASATSSAKPRSSSRRDRGGGREEVPARGTQQRAGRKRGGARRRSAATARRAERNRPVATRRRAEGAAANRRRTVAEGPAVAALLIRPIAHTRYGVLPAGSVATAVQVSRSCAQDDVGSPAASNSLFEPMLEAARQIVRQRRGRVERAGVQRDARRAKRECFLDCAREHPSAEALADESRGEAEVHDLDARVGMALQLEEAGTLAVHGQQPHVNGRRREIRVQAPRRLMSSRSRQCQRSPTSV